MNFVKLETLISILHECTRFLNKLFSKKCLIYWERVEMILRKLIINDVILPHF